MFGGDLRFDAAPRSAVAGNCDLAPDVESTSGARSQLPATADRGAASNRRSPPNMERWAVLFIPILATTATPPATSIRKAPGGRKTVRNAARLPTCRCFRATL